MDLQNLVFKVRDKLNDIGPDKYDDKLVYRDLQDAYDNILMIASILEVNIDDYAEYAVERCIIKLGTYNGYRNYTRLAEQQLGNEPTSSSLQFAYDTAEVRRCLTYLFGVQFDEELIPITINDHHLPRITKMGPSIADYNINR